MWQFEWHPQFYLLEVFRVTWQGTTDIKWNLKYFETKCKKFQSKLNGKLVWSDPKAKWLWVLEIDIILNIILTSCFGPNLIYWGEWTATRAGSQSFRAACRSFRCPHLGWLRRPEQVTYFKLLTPKKKTYVSPLGN